MGGRNSEPVTAGTHPDERAGTGSWGSCARAGVAALEGKVIEWAQAQWQRLPSPSQQVPSSLAEGASMARSDEVSRWAIAVESVAREVPGPSARHTVPEANLTSNTNTANTHRPRWRRSRVSSGVACGGIP